MRRFMPLICLGLIAGFLPASAFATDDISPFASIPAPGAAVLKTPAPQTQPAAALQPATPKVSTAPANAPFKTESAAKESKPVPAPTGASGAPGMPSQGPIDVSADQSLEWYQDQSIYVARGHAKAVRGDMTVDADILTAHEREKPKTEPGQPPPPKVKRKTNDNGTSDNGANDIDRMMAEGNVRITKPNQIVTGQHAVYDLDQGVMVVTGDNLKYETSKETVTAKDSLEYWEAKKIAVARGHAIADKGDRHVKGDVLTAEFRPNPNGGGDELWKMTAEGNVTVITKGDVSRANTAVYDVDQDVAVLRGNVRITRQNGMQLSGDVGEVNFKTNESRLLNEGHGRVRALLPSKSGSGNDAKSKPAQTASQTVSP